MRYDREWHKTADDWVDIAKLALNETQRAERMRKAEEYRQRARDWEWYYNLPWWKRLFTTI